MKIWRIEIENSDGSKGDRWAATEEGAKALADELDTTTNDEWIEADEIAVESITPMEIGDGSVEDFCKFLNAYCPSLFWYI